MKFPGIDRAICLLSPLDMAQWSSSSNCYNYELSGCVHDSEPFSTVHLVFKRRRINLWKNCTVLRHTRAIASVWNSMPAANTLQSVQLMRPPPYGTCHNSSASPSCPGSYVVHCAVDHAVVRCRIEWAVRGLSFGCQSQLIALASEDPYIEIARVDTGTTRNPSSS